MSGFGDDRTRTDDSLLARQVSIAANTLHELRSISTLRIDAMRTSQRTWQRPELAAKDPGGGGRERPARAQSAATACIRRDQDGFADAAAAGLESIRTPALIDNPDGFPRTVREPSLGDRPHRAGWRQVAPRRTGTRRRVARHRDVGTRLRKQSAFLRDRFAPALRAAGFAGAPPKPQFWPVHNLMT